MDFTLNEEQTMLEESVARFVQNDYTFESRQKIVASDLGFSRENWQLFAELGWLGIPFAEDDGGFGGGAVESMVMFENFGKGLLVEPYLATIVLAGGALRLGGTASQKATLLKQLIEGSAQGALAYAEPQARYNLTNVATTAKATDDGYVINGQKALVLNGPAADFVIVSARTQGAQRDHDGISLFVVDASSEGLQRRDYATVDNSRASEMSFNNVAVAADALLGELGAGAPILELVIDEGILALGAEAVGCMQILCENTVEYCKNRTQFGQPIGKFQVLQHRMVDMFMEHEQSKSLMYMAAMRLDDTYGAQAQQVLSALKVQVGKSGRFVGQSAVQLHGGMGMTDELNIGHYFKRLTAIDTLFGNTDFHLDRFGSR
ncbi:MAG: acyl-CoA dehydrogenase family protein [Gammaproteobacteria bacterium]|nr:acyl-CoA dehydrogenase family protein [Gammaproteobacteria bacterium]